MVSSLLSEIHVAPSHSHSLRGTGRRRVRVEGRCEGQHGAVRSVSTKEQPHHGGSVLRRANALC